MVQRRRVVRRRPAVRRRRGRGLASVLTKAKEFLKQHHLVSRGLNMLHGHLGKTHRYAPYVSRAANLASSLGYGRRKRRVVRGRRRGAGFFGDLWNGIKKAGNFIKNNRLISKGLALIPHKYAGIASNAASSIGLGRRRRHIGRRPARVTHRRGRGMSMASMTAPWA